MKLFLACLLAFATAAFGEEEMVESFWRTGDIFVHQLRLQTTPPNRFRLLQAFFLLFSPSSGDSCPEIEA